MQGTFGQSLVKIDKMVSEICILIFKNLFLVNQQCQKIDTWHITLINLENRNPVWPNEFNLQLGCCISDAFSIYLLFMDRTSSFIAEHERSRLASIFFLRSPSHKSVCPLLGPSLDPRHTEHNFGRGSCKEHLGKVWLKLTKWFQRYV
jgi:hypothetical protein